MYSQHRRIAVDQKAVRLRRNFEGIVCAWVANVVAQSSNEGKYESTLPAMCHGILYVLFVILQRFCTQHTYNFCKNKPFFTKPSVQGPPRDVPNGLWALVPSLHQSWESGACVSQNFRLGPCRCGPCIEYICIFH